MTFKLYFGFGLNIYSNYNWTGLIRISSAVSAKETVVIEVDSAKKKPETAGREIIIEKGGQTITYKNKTLGTLKAFNGQRLELNPPRRLNEHSKSILLKWGMATLLHQRGAIVLHGTHLVVNNKGILLTGNTDEEKKPVIKACLEAGGQLISDQMAAITFINNLPCMIPSYPEVPEIYVIPSGPQNHDEFIQQNVKLSSIFYLHPEAGSSPVLLSKFDAFKKIFRQFYLNVDTQQGSIMVDHFRNIEKLLNNIEVYEIRPPKKNLSIKTLLKSIP